MRGAARQRVGCVAALVGGLLLVFTSAACGDDDRGAAPVPTPTIPPLTPTATAENGSALPLQRYHYSVSFTLQTKRRARNVRDVVVKTEGVYEAPDKHAFAYTIASGKGALRQRLVLIGDRAWLKAGDGRWRQVPVGDETVRELLAVAFSPAREGFLGGERYGRMRDAVRRLPAAEETVNGVAVHHYRVSEAGREFFQAFLAEEALLAHAKDFSWDLWLAQEGGWPVRLRASSTVTKALAVNRALRVPAPAVWVLQIDISRPDDPRLAVRPPLDER